ncbi:MAG: sulfotransferase [Bacteroidota bacterium]
MNKKIISIGALGGSGTRAIAEVLIQAGVFMGNDLNNSNDNLFFTRLLKNPKWYKKASINEKNKRLLSFKKHMETGKISLKDLIVYYKSGYTNPTHSSGREFYVNVFKLLFSKEVNREIWGWKEPNTQIYVNEIFNLFPNLKYIHVLRNGLDMAFSNNKQQLNNWGWKYQIELNGNETADELAVKQLDYWIESTRDVIASAKGFENRFLMVKHSEFCQNPHKEIDRILQFCEITISPAKLKELYDIPRTPGSTDRYKNYDLNIFSPEQIQFVKEMGFEIDTNAN